MSATRDPRTDPAEGDVLIYGPQWQLERIKVLSVDERAIKFVHDIHAPGYTHTVSRKSWLEWMRGAEVLQRGDMGGDYDA